MSLKQKKTAWSLSFIVLCVAAVMVPRCHAYPPQAQHYAVGDGTVIGIDIGSANSRVGILSNDILDILDQIPSCVAFTDQGILIGSSQYRLVIIYSQVPRANWVNSPTEAQKEIHKHPSQTICNVRALLGRDWSDPVLQDIIKTLPYRVKEESGKPVIAVEMQGEEHIFTPEHIAGLVMGNLRDTAAKLVDDDVRHAVVAVPTSFNVQQRQAIKDAGATVGLNVLRTVNESTAAAMAYELDRPDHEQNVVVLDMGASKTDVTVLNIDQGVFEVFATASVPMGGDWFNQRFAQQ
ncbi:hypothetical protein Daus18300_009264 [Diaporthe australafricana]|uniref:Uncharacterized protein n=1 Tax=Diaporthe australafricana TaxID=127596 RepID=A0ABR3WF31_9PEZI